MKVLYWIFMILLGVLALPGIILGAGVSVVVAAALFGLTVVAALGMIAVFICLLPVLVLIYFVVN